jgi:hypothetical protein|tara:strand:- start:212 stop:472 length:261 start_codon:yes stop_codon:yes gene_type:complete
MDYLLLQPVIRLQWEVEDQQELVVHQVDLLLKEEMVILQLLLEQQVLHQQVVVEVVVDHLLVEDLVVQAEELEPQEEVQVLVIHLL